MDDVATQRWLLLRSGRELGRRFAVAWRALPIGSFRRWLVTVAVGFILCSLVMWVLTVAGRHWHSHGMQDWDEKTLARVERGPLSFSNAILAESPGNLSYLIPVAAIAAAVSAWRGQPLLALTFLTGYVLARPLIVFGWWLWDRARPQTVAQGIASPPLHSFPSGHVILAITMYGLLAWLATRSSRSMMECILIWLMTALWITLIGLARVRLGTHWPSDTIAGAILGVLWLAVMILAARGKSSRMAT